MSSSEVQVTVVVVPRERFSYTERSLENIYNETDSPFNLVYVDGNSPTKIKRYLESQSREKGFKLVRTEHFLSPNQARNLGLSHVETKYVVFVDNDVLVKKGWLEALVQCSEETGAWVVGPLCLQGEDFKTIHMVGGTFDFREKNGKRWLVERRPFMRLPLAKVESRLQRGPTELVEFHCMLVRAEAFRQVGLLDENFWSMSEEDDFCLCVSQAGQAIYFEPASVMTYVAPSVSQLTWTDLPFFFIRWSDHWCRISVERFREKWNLTEDALTLKHNEDFVKAHRYLAYPKPKRKAEYPVYLVRRVTLAILEWFINWQAFYHSEARADSSAG
jgi:GT2 family glycosyltransferase